MTGIGWLHAVLICGIIACGILVFAAFALLLGAGKPSPKPQQKIYKYPRY